MKLVRRVLFVAVLLGAGYAIGLAIFGTPIGLLAALLDTVVSFRNPPGTLSVEMRPGAAPTEVSATTSDTPDPGEWPSYNRTLTSERYSPLEQINRQNVHSLRVLCTYDSRLYEGFSSGLIMVDGALIGTGVFDTFSIDPGTCKQNWRVHEHYGSQSPVMSSRGAAYLDGRVFRGTLDGRVLAYDGHTGKRLWEVSVANPKLGSYRGRRSKRHQRSHVRYRG
jgi:alcohol dehydrogenase (cytochrome c)